MKKEAKKTDNESSNLGRPLKDKDKKKGEKVFVNITESQKKQLLKIAEREDISLSRVCLNALRKVGYIT